MDKNFEEVKKILVAGLKDYHREANGKPDNYVEIVADLLIRGLKLFEPKPEVAPLLKDASEVTAIYDLTGGENPVEHIRGMR